MADIKRLEEALVNAHNAGDANAARIFAAEIVKAREQPERTAGDIAKDALITGTKGFIGLPQAAAGLADIPFGLAGLGSPVTSGLEKVGVRFADAQKALEEAYSPAQKEAMRRVAETKGFFPTIGAGIMNPSVPLAALGESAPQMLGGAGIAKMLMSKGLPAIAAVGAGEGALGAGSAAAQMREQAPEQGITPKQSLAALALGAGTAAIGAGGAALAASKLGQRIGLSDIDTLIAKGGAEAAEAANAKAGFLKSVAASGFSEGVLEEMPQSGQERMWQNWASDRPLLEGVPEDMAMGFLVGTPLGAVGGAMGRARPSEAPPEAGKPGVVPTPPTEYFDQPSPLENPYGNITADLMPDVAKEINAARSKRKQGSLDSFSIEDAVNAGLPQERVDSILSGALERVGVAPDLQISPEDIYDTASIAGIDTEQPGFTDFLRRATGSDNPEKMSPVQRVAALGAIQNLPEGVGDLPTGTNARSFTEAQYKTGLKAIKSTPAGGVTRDEMLANIQKSGIKDANTAMSVLQNAIRDGNVGGVSAPAYAVFDEAGKVVGRYDDQQEANDRAERLNGSVTEFAQTRYFPKEMAAQQPAPKAPVLPEMQALQKQLAPQLRRFGLEDVGLKVVNNLGQEGADGAYANRLIQIALSAENPMGVMRHESIHALKELGAFKPREWRALEKQAKSEWVDKFIRQPGLYERYQQVYQEQAGSLEGFDEYIAEEAIAEAFKYFDQTKPPVGLIGNLFNRLRNFFASLRNAMQGAGFQTAEDVLGRIEEGKVKPVKAEAPAAAEARYSYVYKGPDKSIGKDDPRGYKIDKIDAADSYTGKALYNIIDSTGEAFETFDSRSDAIAYIKNQVSFYEQSAAQPKFSIARKTDEQFFEGERKQPKSRQVIFEIAPNPDDQDLSTLWKSMPQSERIEISNKLKDRFTKSVMDAVGSRGRITNQVGSYLDETNASYAMYLEKGNPINTANALGFVFKQQSMLVVSPNKANGLREFGSIVVDVGEKTYSEIESIYNTLRGININGNQPITGQTTSNGKMIILNNPEWSGMQTDELSEYVDAALGYTYNVLTENVYASFPEAKDYDYASPENDPAGKAGDIRQRLRGIRDEASEALGKEIAKAREQAAARGQTSPIEGRRVSSDTIVVDGKSRPTRTSNGKLIFPTEEGVRNFWRWFGDSVFVDEQGRPLVMYHGTAREIEEFIPRQANAIFVTPRVGFAADVNKGVLGGVVTWSENWMAENYEDILTPEQIERAKLKALSEIDAETKKDYQLTPKSHHSAFAETVEFNQALLDEMPSRANVIPLFVKAENPFNYDNQNHVRQVVDRLFQNAGIDLEEEPNETIRLKNESGSLADKRYSEDEVQRMLSRGFWPLIEQEEVQWAIRDLKFDGFSVQEMQTKNYAVYDSTQVKSSVGNSGKFSPEKKSIRYSIAQTKTEPFKRFFGESKIVDRNGNPLMMYHATPSPDEEDIFSVFNLSDDGKLGQGIYATSVEKYAEGFAPTGAVMPLWISIKNPLYIDLSSSIGKGRSPRDVLRAKMAGEDQAGKSDYVRLDVSSANEISKLLGAEVQAISGKRLMDMSGASIRRTLQKAGYDGIVVRDADGNFVEVNAFDKTQVKSAVGNRGTFSPKSKDIRYSIAGAPPIAGTDIQESLDGYLNLNDEALREDYIYNNKGMVKWMNAAERDEAYQDALQQNLKRLGFPDEFIAYRGHPLDKPSPATYANVTTNRGYADNFKKAYVNFPKGSKWVVDELKIRRDDVVALGAVDENELIVRLRDDALVKVNVTPDQDIRYSIAGGKAFELDPTESKDNFIYLFQDDKIDLKRVVDGVYKKGNKIADRWNAYEKEESYYGRSAERIKQFATRDLHKITKKMDGANISLQEMDDYLLARHAPEANAYIRTFNSDPKQNAGMSDAEAAAYMQAVPANKRAILEALAKDVDAITKGTRDLMVEYGLEDQKTVDQWAKTYKHYVPLFREETEDALPLSAGRGFSVRGSTSKRRTGSSRKVVDVLANIALQREKVIARGEHNRVGNSLYGMVLLNPNPDFWSVIRPDKMTKDQLRAELFKLGVDPKSVDEMVDRPVEKVIDKKTGMVTYKVSPFWKNQNNLLFTRVNGQDRVIAFNKNDERAMRLVTALKGMDAQKQAEVIQSMGTAGDYFRKAINFTGKTTRYFAAINTQYNPAFGIYNLMRDTGGATINLQATPLKGMERKVVSDAMVALKDIYKDLRRAREGLPPKSKWGQVFDDFGLQGGKSGFSELFKDSQDRSESLQNELKRFKEGKIKGKGRALMEWLSDFNEAIENAIRVSVYKNALDKGLSKQKAASLGKNITVNFNRRGAMSKHIQTLYAFFNAAVQGSARIAQTLMTPDGKLTKFGKQFVVGGITLGMMQAVILAMAGIDDDEIPDYIKDKSIVIPYGKGKYFSIPLPLGFHVVPAFGRRAMEFAMSDDKNVGKAMIGTAMMIADGFNPFGSATFLQTLSPTIADPLVALAENKDFNSKPIAIEDVSSMSPTPGYERSSQNALAVTKAIAYGINILSGGTEFKPGDISPTADQIEYLVGQLTGGVGREALKIGRGAESIVTGEELATYNIPIIGRLVGNTQQQAAQRTRFYDNIKTMNQHQAEMEGRLNSNQDVTEYLKKYPEAALAQEADKIYRKISQLRSEKEELKALGESKESMKRIDDLILELMTGFNELKTSYSKEMKATQ